MLETILERITKVGEQRGVLTSRWTQVDGRRVHARVSTDRAPTEAPAIVLVHGIGVSGRYLIPTAVRLAPYYSVFIPDLPGFGKSAKPDRSLSLTELTDSLARWMTSVDLNRATLLGNSFGCQIVVDFAVRHPDRIERAILVGPTIDPKARSAFKQIIRWMRNSPHEPRSTGIVVLQDYLDCGVRRLFQTFRIALDDSIEKKLPQVGVPTLVVRGGRDPIVPQRWAEETTRLLPAGRLVVIPGAAHTVNYGAPLELVRVIRPFMEAARPSAPSIKREQKRAA